MTHPARPMMAVDQTRHVCDKCGLSYDTQHLASLCECSHEQRVYADFAGATDGEWRTFTGGRKIGDCHHGIPASLRCGACECEAEAPTGIAATLVERGTRYGLYTEHARITQAIKAAMVDSPNWATLAPDMRESLEMLAHKAGRILNGDPNYHDSWRDIVGYAKLVADRLAVDSPPA